MSFARRVVVIALAMQAVGVVREIVVAIGIERYVTTITTLSDPAVAIATGAVVGVLGLLVPLARGNRWATLSTVPLMLVLLIMVVPTLATLFGSPSTANFAVWLTGAINLMAAVVGVPFAILATFESFGRLAPSAALRPEGGFGAAMLFIAGVVGSLVGMTTVAVAVAASPATSGPVAIDSAPDATRSITLRELRFEPARLDLKAGQTTAIFVTNEDAFDHSFDVDELNVHVHVPAGQTTVVVVVPAAAASLALYCGIPGHTEAGMVADLVVR